MPLTVFLDVFSHKKKKKTVDNFACPVNAKDEVFDTKERAVAPAKAPEILRIKKSSDHLDSTPYFHLMQ